MVHDNNNNNNKVSATGSAPGSRRSSNAGLTQQDPTVSTEEHPLHIWEPWLGMEIQTPNGIQSTPISSPPSISSSSSPSTISSSSSSPKFRIIRVIDVSDPALRMFAGKIYPFGQVVLLLGEKFHTSPPFCTPYGGCNVGEDDGWLDKPPFLGGGKDGDYHSIEYYKLKLGMKLKDPSLIGWDERLKYK